MVSIAGETINYVCLQLLKLHSGIAVDNLDVASYWPLTSRQAAVPIRRNGSSNANQVYTETEPESLGVSRKLTITIAMMPDYNVNENLKQYNKNG